MYEPLQALALILALAVIGWGAGLAAAMGWRNLTGHVPTGLAVRVATLVAALLMATSCTYAYVVVLASVGFVDHCAITQPVPVAC